MSNGQEQQGRGERQEVGPEIIEAMEAAGLDPTQQAIAKGMIERGTLVSTAIERAASADVK